MEYLEKVDQIKSAGEVALEEIRKISIRSNENRLNASQILIDIKKSYKNDCDFRDSIINPLKQAFQNAKKRFDEALIFKKQAIEILENKLSEWANRAREREEERKRQAVEAQKQLAETKFNQALENGGEMEVMPAIVEEKSEPIKLDDGTYFKKLWDFEVIDFQAFVKAVAENRIPLNCLEINPGEVRRHVMSLKENLNWDGIKVFPKSSKPITKM